jgi:dethiobiotin synthetase
MKKFIVTGIGTDIGKTVVSSILAEALKATYWKPVQAGDLDNSDSIKIKKWCSENVQVLPEAFRLSQPLSPHSAAEIDNVKITASDLVLPKVDGNFILEGAGGIMVPFNQEGLLFVDLIPMWNLPVILVSRHYLGSINHTLLTAEILQNRGIKIEGIIFVGDKNKSTESMILSKTKLKLIARIPIAEEITSEFIKDQAEKISL